MNAPRHQAIRFLCFRLPFVAKAAASCYVLDSFVVQSNHQLLFFLSSEFICGAILFSLHVPAGLRLLAPERRSARLPLIIFGWSFPLWAPWAFYLTRIDIFGLLPALITTYVLGVCSGRFAWAVAPVPALILAWLIAFSMPESVFPPRLDSFVAVASVWNLLIATWTGVVGLVWPTKYGPPMLPPAARVGQ